MTYQQIEAYCLERLSEAKEISSPWGFLCVASFVDFLAKLSTNADQKSPGYKQFFSQWFPSSYVNFTYANGQQDLPEQFYHVLRCGISHSFSFYPDALSISKGGRVRSVLITHDGQDDDGTVYSHLANYTKNGFDSAILIGGTLCNDLGTVIQNMFVDSTVQANAEQWVIKHPPIGAI